MTISYSASTILGGVRHIEVAGDLTCASINCEGDQLAFFVTASGGTVILDCGQVHAMSGDGLRFVVRCAEDLQTSGGELIFIAPQWGNHDAVLLVAEFLGIFPIFHSLDDCLSVCAQVMS